MLDEAVRALALGNPSAAVRLAVAALEEEALRANRRRAYSILRECIETLSRGAFARRAIDAASEIVGSQQEPDPDLALELEAARERLVAIQRVPLAPPTPGAGTASVLLASDDSAEGGLFGTVARLQVRTSPGRPALSLLGVSQQPDSVLAGLRVGALGAIDALACLGEQAGWRSYVRVEARFPSMAEPMKGESVGLAAAAATLSSIVGVPVPEDTGFTGRVLLGGAVEPVGGLRAKLEAAADFGIRRVFLADRQSVPTAPTGLAVARCGNVADLVSRLDLTASTARLEERLAEYRVIPIDELLTPWQVPAQRAPVLGGTLLSAVARSDPFGRIRDRQGKEEFVEDGPLLAICREIRPNHLVLLFTVGLGQDNDYSDNAHRVHDLLAIEHPELDIELHPLKDVTDPIDLRQILPTFRRVVEAHVKTQPLFANMTSGTPDMQFAWLLLKAHGVNLHLVRALESRFAERASRVRLILPPPV